MKDMRIDPRPGLEVFVNQSGSITIAQIEIDRAEQNLVIVHPDDVPRLIEMLQIARKNAADFVSNEAQDG